MAHKRKDKDKKKEHVVSRKDTSHRKELRDYERKRGRIVLLSVSIAVILAILLVPTVLFIGTPWTDPVVGGEGNSLLDPGKPPKTDPIDVDVGDDDDDDDILPGDNPRITINVQGYGAIVLELDAERAPITVSNFIQYAQEGYYNGLIFHRVIEGFMVQGGGFNTDMTEKQPPYPPIKNEAASSGLLNDRGTIAMARTSDPDSATSQFFINTVDNDFLNPGGNSQEGYAVFGRVISGMSVVDKIESVSTTTENGHSDVPVEDVIISSVTVQG